MRFAVLQFESEIQSLFYHRLVLNYLLFLLNEIQSEKINIITPKEKGCQISIQVQNADKKLFKMITKKGVIADWREPDVIRIAPVPLYNNYTDVYKFYKILDSLL